jgi:hypothetical protein
MEFPAEIQKIIDKINRKEKLSEEEEFLYLTKVVGHSEEYAHTILSIIENKNPNLIID